MIYEIEYRGHKIQIEKLSSGKFKKPNVSIFCRSGYSATWLDKCRIPTEKPVTRNFNDFTNIHSNQYGSGKEIKTLERKQTMEGRFPANLLISDDVLNIGTDKGTKPHPVESHVDKYEGWGNITKKHGEIVNYGDSGSFGRYFDLDRWWEKKVEELPESVKKTFPFLICPKASKSERNKGCESLPEIIKSNLPLRDGTGNYVENTMGDGSKSTRATKTKNFHPTVKPVKLMSYLVTLGSREGDVVLDPFIGSGTTALACKLLNRNYVGVEVKVEYVEIANKRLATIPEKLEKIMGLKRIKQ